VPRLLELELAVLGQPELLGVLPVLAPVGRPVHVCPVGERVRAGVERSVAWVDDRVEDLPPGEERPLDAPVATAVVALEHEESLPCPRENEHRR
jgi:hypothetical protein